MPQQYPMGSMDPKPGLLVPGDERPYGIVSTPRKSRSRRGRGRGGHRHRRRKGFKQALPWVIGAVLAILLVVGGIVAFRIAGSIRVMREDAQKAVALMDSYVDAAKAGNAEQLGESARDLSGCARKIRKELSLPEWTIASNLPFLGSDVRSVRVLGDVLLDLSNDVLVPLADNSGVLELSNLMSDSTINIGALQGVTSAIAQAAPVIKSSAETVRALPKANLPQVASVLERVRMTIVGASDIIDRMSPILPYLPYLLGADGQTKTYLVVASNVAEIHAVGGFAGLVGRLEVTDGHISLGDFSRVADAMPYDGSGGGATPEEINVIGERCDVYSGDHNCVLNWARAGQIFHDHWMRTQNQDVDGVLSFDPVFLQYMLGLVGELPTSFGVTVDGNNAASMIMNECLFAWEPTVCDDFYQEVAHLALGKMLSGLGSVDTAKFTETLVKASSEGRCLAWLRDEGAEAAAMQAGFGWELPHDPAKPLMGIFVNDWSVSKASYYLDINTEVGEPQRGADGSSTYAVKVALHNTANRSLLNDVLPSYVKVNDASQPKRSDLDLFEQVFITAPEGGRIQNLHYQYTSSVSKAPDLEWGEKRYEGLDTYCCYVLRLDADEVCDITYEVVTAPEATEPLAVRKSPVMPPELRM